MYLATTHQATTLTLTGSHVSGNSAWGAFAGGGGLWAGNSKYFAGSAPLANSTVTLTNSTVSGNTACGTVVGLGGGVGTFKYNTVLALNNSTVSGNAAYGTTAGLGGGVFAWGDSSATLTNSTVTLTNSTVSGNSAAVGSDPGTGAGDGGGGMATKYTSTTLNDSTVSSNSATHGGGILASSDTLSLFNTILAGNTAAIPDGDLYAVSTSLVNASYSLLGTALDTSPYNASGNHNVFSDAPGLEPLNDNGGPTQTMLPDSTSPAIDQGSNALAVDPEGHPLTTAQRGFPRKSGTTVDIGAVEYQQTLGIVPAPVDFGAVAVNSGSIDRTVTVNAPDGGKAVLGTVSLGTPAGAFSLGAGDHCSSGHTLDSTTPTCTLTVAFAPTTVGAQSTTLTVPYGSGKSTSVTVQGSATSNTVSVGGTGPAGARLTLTGSNGNSDPNCGLVSAAFLSPGPTPPGGDSVVGLPVSFTVAGCTPGATVTLSLDLGTNLPAGASVYKFGPTAADTTPHWYPLPGASINGSTLSFSVTDGSAGDSDLIVNGSITDPVAALKAPPPVASPIPALSVWGVALLSAMLGLVSGWPWRRRRRRE